MMSKKSTVPDAWDDDWENQVDTGPQEISPAPSKKVSQAQRRAQQAEFNKQLWEEASEAPKTFHFLDARQNTVPLKSEFKPAMTVLSRKPNQSLSSSHRASSDASAIGVDGLSLNDAEYEDNSDDGTARKTVLTPEQRRLQIQREHEQKQRKYEEARGRLFGTSSTGSGTSSPGNTTPPRENSTNKSKGKGRVGANARETGGRGSPGRNKQLFDPSYTPKPDSTYLAKRDSKGGKDDENGIFHPLRQPRQPDGTGGFVTRQDQ